MLNKQRSFVCDQMDGKPCKTNGSELLNLNALQELNRKYCKQRNNFILNTNKKIEIHFIIHNEFTCISKTTSVSQL